MRLQLFSKSIKEFFDVKGEWHSPDALHTMVRGQVFLIINWRPQWHREDTPIRITITHWTAPVGRALVLQWRWLLI